MEAVSLSEMSAILPVVWQTMHDSLVDVIGPAGPVDPSEPSRPGGPWMPWVPWAPSDPEPHPMKSNGTTRKIEHIRTSILFDMNQPLLFLWLKT